MSADRIALVSQPRAEHPPLIGAGDLLANFKPIESIVDGLPAPRGGVVSITGPTGSGKTTLAALLQVSLRVGHPFAGREVTPGTVLVLAGENPDDYAMHLAATVQELGLSRDALGNLGSKVNLHVIPGTFDVLAQLDWIELEMRTWTPNVIAVFVDTSAAYYLADDENDNVQMRRHASALRELTTLPGQPTVFVLAHPTKSATRDNLLPRGGGAFLAEVDANWTTWKDDAGIVTLHWAGKIRGPSFEPIKFELVPVELQGHVDCRGRPIFSVAARHIADERAEQLHAKELDDQDRLLIEMQKRPGASIRDLGMRCGWTNGVGQPLRGRVTRRLDTLREQGLAKPDRKGKWFLTTKGEDEARGLP